MYIKFLKSKNGGGTGAVNYLLNEREKEETAKVLEGNPDLTRNLILSLGEKKQKVTFGVLSFEEKADFLTVKDKHKIIEDFEKTLFPGMNKNQYNILWIEHSDKNRLELNFVIPKIELSTQKSFNPYYHRADFSRIEMFEDIQNIKYKLSSKKDPEKKQTLTYHSNLKNCPQDYKKLDEDLHQLVLSKKITSRAELIDFLKKREDLKISRTSKDYISIKFNHLAKPKRFKNDIYSEKFVSLGMLDLEKKLIEKSNERFKSRDTEAELKTIEARLSKYNSQKAQSLKKLYPYNEPTKEEKEPYAQNIEHFEKPNLKEKEEYDKLRADVERRDKERERVLKEVRERTSKPRESIFDRNREKRESLYDTTRKIMQQENRYIRKRFQFGRTIDRLRKGLKKTISVFTNVRNKIIEKVADREIIQKLVAESKPENNIKDFIKENELDDFKKMLKSKNFFELREFKKEFKEQLKDEKLIIFDEIFKEQLKEFKEQLKEATKNKVTIEDIRIANAGYIQQEIER